MSQNHSAPRRRSRVDEQAQHFYTARAGYSAAEEPYEELENPVPVEPSRAPAQEPMYSYDAYPANDGYAEEEPDMPQVDYSAYYSRDGAAQEEGNEPAFAAPVHLQYYGYESQLEPVQEAQDDYGMGNVYRPRQATWAEEERQEMIAESELGYQVRSDEAPVRKKKKKKKKRRHTLRNLLIVLLILALLVAGVFFLWEPVMQWLKEEEILPEPTQEPFEAVVTPEPIKAYDAAPKAEVASSAQKAITQLSNGIEMESHIVTDAHVVTRHQRADGSYDFYLFESPNGRLLCYFEGLGAQDMIPQEGGSFYVNQEPYLISPSGSALVRTADLESQHGEDMLLHPLYQGWAVVESVTDQSANYINQSGQVLSTLWFSCTFPFTGDYKLAYVDTGLTADEDQRYLLYVLGKDGSMSRWLAAGHMKDAVAAVGGMAYMHDGSLYRLPDTSAPVLKSPRVDAYLDCDALVVQDAHSGKYGLLVHGEQHYDCVYDSIRPVESDIQWAKKTLGNGTALMNIYAVSGVSYPQPRSHSFLLEKDGQREYVALSAISSYPIRLDGEF